MATESTTPGNATAATTPPPKKRSKFLTILLVLAVLIVGFLIVVALQPDQFVVARSLSMKGSPQTVFEQVNDFHRWTWNPWGKIDPNMKVTYAGPEAGPGASYAWVGNNEVGEGKMTILESKPGELVRVKLEFLKPFPGNNIAEFTFKPREDQTFVTWSMSGTKNFISKAICMFMSMDKMIGDQFEKGLQDMKTIVEAEPKKS